MTPRQPRRISPGPSWAVLSDPVGSSLSTPTNPHSDIDIDLDADMGSEQESTPISKRKAPADESTFARKPYKLPRLDLDEAMSTTRASSDSSSRHGGHASHTQPGSSIEKALITPQRLRARRAQSTSSGASTSDFPHTLSQVVKEVNARKKEKEKARGQDGETSRRKPPVTARKQTVQVRKVTTLNLLAKVQTSTRDKSVAWTRIRPKAKQKRTSYNEEIGRAHLLDMARKRGDTIDLTHWSDSTRPRSSRVSSPQDSRSSVSVNEVNHIVITSGSEDDQIRPTQQQKSGSGAAQGKGTKSRRSKAAPPPADAEVTLISDSDEDFGTSGTASMHPMVSTAVASTSRVDPPLPPSQRAPTTSPAAPPPATVSPPTVLAPELSPKQNQSTSYAPPPDAYDNVDFDTAGDDANANGALDEWDNLDVRPSLATMPAVISSGFGVSDGAHAGALASVDSSVPDRTDGLFNSYVNMDQVEGDTDQAMGEGVLPGSEDEDEEGASEDGVTNGLGVLTSTGGGLGRADRPDADGEGDAQIQSLEEGELDPNELQPPSRRYPGTPESGEIWSQEPLETPNKSHPIVPPRVASQPAGSRLVPVPIVARLSSPISASPRSSVSPMSASQPLERMRTLAIPDISSYKGIRFKRPLPEARENSFFSRALNSATRSEKVPERDEQQEEGIESGGMFTTVDVQPSVGEAQNQGADTNVQDDTVIPMPTSPQQPEEAPMVPDMQCTFSGMQVQASTVEPNATTTTNDNQPVSARPTMPSTPPQPLAATQSLIGSSSHPFIGPPRVPRPSAPMSLVEALNEVRRGKLQVRREEREPTRRHSVVNVAAQQTTSSDSAGQAPTKEPSQPTQPSTPMPSALQSTRRLEKMPSLNDLRTLLARRNVDASAGQSTRSTSSTPPTTQLLITSLDGNEDSHVATEPEPITVHAPAPTQVLASTDVQDRPSPEGAEAHKTNTRNPPTPTTTTASTAESSTSSSSAHARRRRPISSFPFEAFISPVHARPHMQNDRGGSGRTDKGKAKAKEVDPSASTSPTAPRSRASLGTGALLGSQWPAGRASGHARRESTSAVFEVYIVRDSPKQARAGTNAAAGAKTSSDAGPTKSFPQPPTQPKFSEGSESLSVSVASTSAASTAVPDEILVTISKLGVGGDGSADDTNAMDVILENVVEVDKQAEDVGVDVTDMDEGMASNNGKPEGAQEADEADALLELASVHLSQPEGMPECAMHEVDEVGLMEVMEQSPGFCSPCMEASETREVKSVVMVADDSLVDVDTRRSDGKETIPQPVLDDASGQPSIQAERIEPAEEMEAFESENNVASTKGVALEGDDPVRTSRMTTPDLILPESDNTSTELPSISICKVTDQDDAYDAAHKRRRSGGEDSIDECDALLAVPAEYESDSEAVPVSSLVSSRTVSSSSLAPPRVLPRSSRNNSKETTSTDSLNLLRRPSPVPDQPRDVSNPRSGPGYMCGYRVVTWASYAAEQRELPPQYKLARDLPHSLQDYMNSLPATFRNSDVARRIFEAHIQEAMINEPDTPAIEIFDNDIGDEVTPQWEFHYTNDMWYAEGVPPPDVRNLESCDCIGRCDPKSGKCACAKRQLRWVQSYIDEESVPSVWPGSPFVYDHKGVLQRLECPIFECNRFCHCDEDCPNRVVQNGRKFPVHIVRTKHKGWGVSAGNKKIPKGSYIGIYAGELLTEQEGERRGKYYDLYGRTYLFSVDFHHLKLGKEDPDEWDNLYVVDAYHAGNFTRFLNHSCDPNCRILACYIDDADVNKPLLAVFTTRDVEPWEELCFSYFGDIDESFREELKEAREAGEELVRERAVYTQCRCGAENCIGRLFN